MVLPQPRLQSWLTLAVSPCVAAVCPHASSVLLPSVVTHPAHPAVSPQPVAEEHVASSLAAETAPVEPARDAPPTVLSGALPGAVGASPSPPVGACLPLPGVAAPPQVQVEDPPVTPPVSQPCGGLNPAATAWSPAAKSLCPSAPSDVAPPSTTPPGSASDGTKASPPTASASPRLSFALNSKKENQPGTARSVSYPPPSALVPRLPVVESTPLSLKDGLQLP